MTNVEKIIEAESRAFENKEVERLFEEFYSPDLRVYHLDSPGALVEAFRAVREALDQAAQQSILDSVRAAPSKLMFGDVSVLKKHVIKQFEDFESIKVGMVESHTTGNQLLAYQTKEVDGRVIHVLVLYQFASNKIESMWQAKIEASWDR